MRYGKPGQLHMSIQGLLGLLLLTAGGWYWFNAMRAKELARQACRQRCNDVGVIFLDDTAALTRLRLRRDSEGRVRIYREYQFEFTSDGSRRYGGEIALLGGHIKYLILEPYREAGSDVQKDVLIH